MEPVIAQAIFESINLLTRGMSTLRELCIVGIEANEEVCRRNVLDSIGIVTYLNPVIGQSHGDLVGRECARSGRSVREVVLEMGLLEESVLDEILSPENLLRPHFRDLSVYSGSRSVNSAGCVDGDRLGGIRRLGLPIAPSHRCRKALSDSVATAIMRRSGRSGRLGREHPCRSC